MLRILVAWICSTGLALAPAAAGPPLKIAFDDSPAGSLPAEWSAAKTGEGPGSVWQIVAEQASGQTNHVLAQTSSAGPNPLFNLCVRKSLSFADVELTVRLKAISGQHDQGGGLVWRYQDASNYYVTRWNPLEDNFRVYHVVGGKRTQLASADVRLAADQWHALRVLHRGQHIQCWLDDKLLLDLRDDAIGQPGAIGLWTKADAVTWFDDFTAGSPRAE